MDPQFVPGRSDITSFMSDRLTIPTRQDSAMEREAFPDQTEPLDLDEVRASVDSARSLNFLSDAVYAEMIRSAGAFLCIEVRNPRTRQCYRRAFQRFLSWCERREVPLHRVDPIAVAAYIEGGCPGPTSGPGDGVGRPTLSTTSVKQHLAALRSIFDALVRAGLWERNPAASVRGPRHSRSTGLTPVLSASQMGQILEAIDTRTVLGARDRALISLMLSSFARVSAATSMNLGDYRRVPNDQQATVRLIEKNGIEHVLPLHPQARSALEFYLEIGGLIGSPETGPLFQTIDGSRRLTGRRLSRGDAWAMVKRRVRAAGIDPAISPHSFRATGITTYLQNGGTLETAQRIAAHANPKTTKLYDRRNEAIDAREIARVPIP